MKGFYIIYHPPASGESPRCRRFESTFDAAVWALGKDIRWMFVCQEGRLTFKPLEAETERFKKELENKLS